MAANTRSKKMGHDDGTSDITFSFFGQTKKAHKITMVRESGYFNALLKEGRWAESKMDVIPLTWHWPEDEEEFNADEGNKDRMIGMYLLMFDCMYEGNYSYHGVSAEEPRKKMPMKNKKKNGEKKDGKTRKKTKEEEEQEKEKKKMNIEEMKMEIEKKKKKVELKKKKNAAIADEAYYHICVYHIAQYYQVDVMQERAARKFEALFAVDKNRDINVFTQPFDLDLTFIGQLYTRMPVGARRLKDALHIRMEDELKSGYKPPSPADLDFLEREDLAKFSVDYLKRGLPNRPQIPFLAREAA